MINCTIDRRGMDQLLGGLQDALIGSGQAGDAANLIEQEARLFLKQVIKFTPPKSPGQGKKAIRRDITRTMRPFNPEEIFDRRPAMAERLKRLKRAGDHMAIQEFLMDQPGAWKNWRVQRFDKRHHRQARGSRGRVQRSGKLFILEEKEWKGYVAMMEKRAGRFKASWAAAYIAHGGKVAVWIERHLPSPKSIHFNGLSSRTNPSITFGSSSPDARVLRSKLMPALRARKEAIRRRIELILSDYAKDVAAGMRPKRKVQRIPDPEVVQ